MAKSETTEKLLEEFMEGLIRRNPGEPEYHQAVEEVAASIIPYIRDRPEYREALILERMAEPDRIISFRVAWEDDNCQVRVNRGYRVQCNNAIGPYKGGIRFHKNVTQSVLKFLAFEQTFKNSLTGLPMGGGKGGADFNPHGKSDNEVMHFCQAFMNELYRHIGPNTDVPAGDIGVGAREISYMFGQYKRIQERVRWGANREGAGFRRQRDTNRSDRLWLRVHDGRHAEASRIQPGGSDGPGVRFGECRAVHRREGPPAGGKSRDDVRLIGVHS